MLIPWWVKALVIGALLVGAGLWVFQTGRKVERADWVEAQLAAEQTTKEVQRLQQMSIDKLSIARDETNKRNTDRLLATIDSLRNRPDRSPDLSEAPRATCTGANGPELAGSHAGFLARYAAEAARQDAALAECYGALDASKQSFEGLAVKTR